MKWFSINEKLPKPNIHCLTFSPDIEGVKYRILCTNNGKFFSDVTHWQYLKPPINKKEICFKPLKTIERKKHICFEPLKTIEGKKYMWHCQTDTFKYLPKLKNKKSK